MDLDVRKIFKSLPVRSLIELNNDVFIDIIPYLSASRISTMLLEMNEIEITNKWNLIPFENILNSINLFEDSCFKTVIHNTEDYQISDILRTVKNEKLSKILIILKYENNSNKLRAYIDNIDNNKLEYVKHLFDDTIFEKIPDSICKKIVHIGPLLSKTQAKQLLDSHKDDTVKIEKTLLHVNIENIKFLVESLNALTKINVLGNLISPNVGSIISLNPSFLQICIGLTFSTIKFFMFPFVSNLTPSELKICIKLISNEYISILTNKLSLSDLISVIPSLDPIQVRYIFTDASDTTLVTIIPHLSNKQIFFAFSELEVSSFWKIIPLLSCEQLWVVIPVITYDQKQSVIEKYFTIATEVIEFYIELVPEYIIAIGVSFYEIRNIIFDNFIKLSRRQIWYAIPIIQGDYIYSLISKIPKNILTCVLNNIKQDQIFELATIIERKCVGLNITEKRMNNLYKNISKRIDTISNNLEIKNYENVDDDLIFVRKYNLELVSLKVEYNIELQAQEILKNFSFCPNYKRQITGILVRKKSLSDNIHKIQTMIDSGDGVNGIANEWLKVKPKKDDSISVLDNSIASDTDKVWEIYNNVKESFVELFDDEDKLGDINLCWEDLIEMDLLTVEDYDENDIETLEELKNFYNFFKINN